MASLPQFQRLSSDYDDNEIEILYDQLQNVLDQTPKKDILVVQGNWNAKVGKDERGLRLLEFAAFNDLVLVNTFGQHSASRTWTWRSPNGQYQNDYILVMNRFRSGVNIARTLFFSRSRHWK